MALQKPNNRKLLNKDEEDEKKKQQPKQTDDYFVLPTLEEMQEMARAAESGMNVSSGMRRTLPTDIGRTAANAARQELSDRIDPLMEQKRKVEKARAEYEAYPLIDRIGIGSGATMARIDKEALKRAETEYDRMRMTDDEFERNHKADFDETIEQIAQSGGYGIAKSFGMAVDIAKATGAGFKNAFAGSTDPEADEKSSFFKDFRKGFQQELVNGESLYDEIDAEYQRQREYNEKVHGKLNVFTDYVDQAAHSGGEMAPIMWLATMGGALFGGTKLFTAIGAKAQSMMASGNKAIRFLGSVLSKLTPGNIASGVGLYVTSSASGTKEAVQEMQNINAQYEAVGLPPKYTDEEIEERAALFGTLTGITEAVGEHAIGGLYGTSTGGITKSIKNPLIKAVASWLIGGVGEGVEESIQTLASYGLKNTVYDAGVSVSWREVLDSGIVGFLMGETTAFPTAVSNTQLGIEAQNAIADALKTAGKVKNDAEAGVAAVNASAQAKAYAAMAEEVRKSDSDNADTVAEIYDWMAERMQQISDAMTDDKKRAEIVARNSGTLDEMNRIADRYGIADGIADTKRAKPEDVARMTQSIRDYEQKNGINITDRAGAGTETAQGARAYSMDANQRSELIDRTGRESGAAKGTISFAHDVSSITGRGIRFYRQAAQNGYIENGYYDPDTDTVYINTASKNPAAQILAHELTHSVEGTDSYLSLRAMVFDLMRRDGVDIDAKYREKEMLYSEAGYRLRDEGEIAHEVIAEYVEQHLLTDEASIRDLAKENRTLGQRIREWLDSVLAKLGNASAKERDYVRRVRDMYAKALGEDVTAGQTGESEKKRSLVGERANVNTERLAAAKQMEAEGKSDEEIYRETGWYRQEADGKWRTELLDEIMEPGNLNREGFPELKAQEDERIREWREFYKNLVHRELAEYEEAIRRGEEPSYNAKKAYKDVYGETTYFLPVYLNAPKLYEAYPELKTIPLIPKDLGEGNLGGFNGTMTAPKIYVDFKQIDEFGVPLEELLTHEIQHVIQTIEGFAPGANLEEAGSFEAYEAAPGEVEARNAADRLHMTPEERRQTRPEKVSWDAFAAEVEKNYGFPVPAEELKGMLSGGQSRVSPEDRRKNMPVRDLYAKALGDSVGRPRNIAHSLQRVGDTYYVKADKVIFTREDGTPASQRDVFNALVGETIETPDGSFEIVNRLPGKSMYDELYKRRPSRYTGVDDIKTLNSDVNYNMEELLENTTMKKPNVPDKDGKHSEIGIKDFDTRTVKFYDGTRAYDIEFSIATLQDGRKIGYAKKYFGYDAELTKKIQEAEAMGGNSQLNQQPVSNNSISQDDGNVNREFSVSKADDPLEGASSAVDTEVEPLEVGGDTVTDAEAEQTVQGLRNDIAADEARYRELTDIVMSNEEFLSLMPEEQNAILEEMKELRARIDEAEPVTEAGENVPVPGDAEPMPPYQSTAEYGMYDDMEAEYADMNSDMQKKRRETQKLERENLREAERELERQFEEHEKEQREINRRQREEDRKREIERGEIKTVAQRLEANLQSTRLERSDVEQMRQNAAEEYRMIIDEVQKRYDALNNKNTAEANDLLRRIARIENRARNEEAFYRKRLNDIDEKIGRIQSEIQSKDSPTEQRNMRRDLHESILYRIKEAFTAKGFNFDKILAKAKDLTTFATVDNTPQRVMEKAFGYKEGNVLADLTVNQTAKNETEGIRWLNQYTGKDGVLAKLSEKYHIKPGSKESAAAQMYAEGFYVNEYDEIVEYGDRELAADFPDAQVQKNIKGLARDPVIRQIYDQTLDAINASRARNAYPEIQKLDNYYLHFRAMDDTFSRLGVPFNPNDIRAKDLPTDLSGVTADLKPGQPYFASAMHRKGKRTSFDLLGGLEKYLTSAKNQIYHIDDIQTLRALRNYIADMYGQGNGLQGLDDMDEDAVQERIKQVYDSHLSTFAKFLNEEANIIAGKTSLIDRGLEGVIGRRGITFLNDVNRQVGANMVGWNISSSLTNVLPVVQAFAKTNKLAFVKGFAQTVQNRIASITGKGDGFAETSDVIVRRKGADRYHRTPWQKASDAGYLLMGMVDDISTEIIARAKYNELTAQGMDAETANRETDKWVSRLMGDRSLGQMPQIFNSKMLGLVTKFQLEVRNQIDAQFYDTIKEAQADYAEIGNKAKRNAKIAAKVTATFAELAIAQHLFGAVFESIAGYNPAFDIIEVIAKVIGLDDDEESEDTVLDNIEQGVLALIEDLPYSSVLMDGGRVPVSAAMPIGDIIKGEDQYGNEVNRLQTAAEALPYYVLPGGYGQIKKTAQGLSMFTGDKPVTGSYTDSGNLRFQVEATPGNVAQAAVFGQWANENARDYFDNERKAITQRQAEGFAESGLEWKEFQNIRTRLSKLKTNAEKIAEIASMDISVGAKEAMYLSMVATVEKDDEGNVIGTTDDDVIRALKGAGLDFDDFLSAKQKQSSLNADKSLSANQRASRFLAWVASEGYTEKQADIIGESFGFASGFRVKSETYQKIVDGGVTPDNAVKVSDALSGTKRSIDKINAIWSTGLTGEQLDRAIKAVLTESAYEKYRIVIDANVPLEAYTWVLDNADTNGNGSINAEERLAALQRLDLPMSELSALWLATGGSEKSNPYADSYDFDMDFSFDFDFGW